MAAPSVLCLSCGTSNPAARPRCAGCGAKVAVLTDDVRAGGERSVFAPSWFGVGLVGYSVVLGVVIVALPFVLSKYDPQGMAGLLIALAIWMVGGLFVGAAAKDARVLEPSAAAALTAVVILPYLSKHSDVGQLDVWTWVVGGALGILAAFLGAYFGDRLTSAKAPS